MSGPPIGGGPRASHRQGNRRQTSVGPPRGARATLTIFAQIGDKPRELLLTALIRPRFCHQAGHARDGSRAERFTLDLFSVLHALTDTPMPYLPFPRHMSDALIDHAGAGRLLVCIQAIEYGDFAHAD
jgi:c-di-GMP-related signal transduction protein